MNIPEGYILVPIIPTEEMIGAGQNQEWTEDVYAAMIGAAPFVCESSVEEYDETKERELFETAYPLDNGVTWVKDMGKTGSYAVHIDSGGGFWACVNASYHLQIKWEVWSKCAKSRARSSE